ncbi:nucleotidyltransferase domain-containing protein [Candidatus Woesearchaeota archaeon]|nr:nucleotidyltransferase domain-containing protein [Candidatus Woesearchaeota archaeon]
MKSPEKFLTTKERKEMWEDASKILKKIDSEVSEVYLVGSYASEKKPNDIDFVIVTKSKNKNQAYPVDLIVVPDSEDLDEYLDFFKEYMKKKFGKDVEPVRLK